MVRDDGVNSQPVNRRKNSGGPVKTCQSQWARCNFALSRNHGLQNPRTLHFFVERVFPQIGENYLTAQKYAANSIKKYEFIEGVDFIKFPNFGES